MLLVAVRIKNYKVIREITIKPDADRYLLMLQGMNMQGKTSVMDAITALIGGKSAIAPDPVRHGEVQAEIEGWYDNGLHIRRIIEPNGDTKLEVKDESGKVSSPQDRLKRLLGQRMLDPVEFVRLDAPEQRKRLLQIIDKDNVIAAMDVQRERVFTARTEVGRKLKDAEGEFHRAPPALEVPASIDVGELGAELTALTAKQQAGQRMELAHGQDQGALTSAKRALENLDSVIAELEAKLASTRGLRPAHVATLEATQKKVDASRVQLEGFAAEWSGLLPRRDEIDNDLARANAHNREVVEIEQNNRRREQAEKVVSDRQRQYETGTAELAKIDARKLAFLAAADLPVPGLGIDDGGVTFNGVPLASASGAEKLRIALGIAIKSQSEIKDILIRDASLLDDDSLQIVEEIATAAEVRCWLEMVGTRNPEAITIREGTIAEEGEAQ